jgi:PadR family transcriptional regulator, regulatory protein PadR
MKSDQEYLSELLDAWELSYKKGLLSFWILAAVHESPRTMEEIQAFMQDRLPEGISYDDQSVYRALRRFDDVELIRFEAIPNDRGPALKRYSLTSLGARLLSEFARRNLRPYTQKDFQNLIQSILK